MVSVSQNTHQHKPLMVQAPVRALDPDGVAVVTAGTIGFGVAVVLCWLSYGTLAVAGKGWYLGVAIAGTGIGVLGLAIGVFRKVRRRRSGDDAETEADLPGRRGAAPRRAAVEPEDQESNA